MINELYTLSQCLQRCGIQVGKPHRDIKAPGKSEGFVIGINKKGMPETLEYVSAEKMAKLWTLRKGKHNSFPFVKLKKPIWGMSFNDPIWGELKKLKRNPIEKINKLQHACKNLKLYKDQKGNLQDISLASWTREQIDHIRCKDEKIDVFVELADRFLKVEKTQEDFFRGLSELILKGINDQSVDAAAAILIGDVKGKEVVCDASLFFDVSDWDGRDKYHYRVAEPEMGKLVSRHLPKPSKKDGISVFGSKEWQTDSYPDPTLPAIGSTYLFSMNEDIPCHIRYGKIASAICPVSPDEVIAMHGALEWIVDGGREGKTWRRIPNIKREQDLLIAYLEEMPESPAELASCISEFDSNESEMKEADYEQRSRAVCDALKGEKGLSRDSKVNILVLTKVDEGRRQVVLNSSYTVKNIVNSVEQWQIAAKNRPHFLILLPRKKGEGAKLVEPFCPSPAEVMRCLQNQWVRNGLGKCDVPGVALRTVYDLFLGDERIAQETARMILSLVLQRSRQLLIGFAAADHAGNIKDYKDYSIEARRTVLVGISVLGIILHKLGIKKEDYMRNAAFNVGKLLAFADSLHAQYCKLQMKRKGDLPPQLIGNAVLPVAFENPDKALVFLGDRLRIYYAWATKVQGDEYKLVKWMMSKMGEISAELENVAWPSMNDDAAKAQVLLGYLARPKSEE